MYTHIYVYIQTQICGISTVHYIKKAQRPEILYSIVTFHFILTDKPGRGWTKSKVNSGNFSKLQKFRGLHRLASRKVGLPNSSYTKNMTPDCSQWLFTLSTVFIVAGG